MIEIIKINALLVMVGPMIMIVMTLLKHQDSHLHHYDHHRDENDDGDNDLETSRS